MIDPKRERDDPSPTTHTPDGPHEIEDAAAQELEYPSDEGDEA